MRKAATAAVLSLTLALVACNGKTKPTPENYIATLNAYFVDHPDCLLSGVRFPYEAGAEADPSAAQMDALASAQLLEVKHDPGIHTSRYTLTPAGERIAPRFCFGHRQVAGIESSTPPAPANGFTETQVSYRYTLADVPVWAQTPAVVAAFPKLAAESAGSSRDKATLALTGVGWSVPE